MSQYNFNGFDDILKFINVHEYINIMQTTLINIMFRLNHK